MLADVLIKIYVGWCEIRISKLCDIINLAICLSQYAQIFFFVGNHKGYWNPLLTKYLWGLLHKIGSNWPRLISDLNLQERHAILSIRLALRKNDLNFPMRMDIACNLRIDRKIDNIIMSQLKVGLTRPFVHALLRFYII